MQSFRYSTDTIRTLLQQAEREGYSRDVTEKLEWFLYYLEQGASISQTCRHFGIARSTFHRWADRFDAGNLHSLEERSHRPHRLRQRSVSPDTIHLIRRLRMHNPDMGKGKIAEMLSQQYSIDISSSTVGRIIQEQQLYFAAPVYTEEHRTTQTPPTAVAEDEWTEFTRAGKAALKQFWRKIRRPLLITSLIANLAFAAVLTATAHWEKQAAAEKADRMQEAHEIIEQMLLERSVSHAAASEFDPPTVDQDG